MFEIAKTASGYASTPTTLVSFNGSGNGADPQGSLIADANGDLFGTTASGGANGDGTVFEIAKTAHRLRQHPHHPGQLQRQPTAPRPVRRPDRRRQRRPVRHDISGGATGDGTVFEIAKTAAGYASTPTTLVSFNGSQSATNPGTAA